MSPLPQNRYMFICDQSAFELAQRVNELSQEGWQVVSFYVVQETTKDVHYCWLRIE